MVHCQNHKHPNVTAPVRPFRKKTTNKLIKKRKCPPHRLNFVVHSFQIAHESHQKLIYNK